MPVARRSLAGCMLPGPEEVAAVGASRQSAASSPRAFSSSLGRARLALEINPELGVAEGLTESEQIELCACEEVIRTGWSTFVQVGLALARIRDGQLYKTDFQTFEAYCRLRWEYGRRYVDQLISAAQVFTHLRATSSHHLMTKSHQIPDHETQHRQCNQGGPHYWLEACGFEAGPGFFPT